MPAVGALEAGYISIAYIHKRKIAWITPRTIHYPSLPYGVARPRSGMGRYLHRRDTQRIRAHDCQLAGRMSYPCQHSAANGYVDAVYPAALVINKPDPAISQLRHALPDRCPVIYGSACNLKVSEIKRMLVILRYWLKACRRLKPH